VCVREDATCAAASLPPPPATPTPTPSPVPLGLTPSRAGLALRHTLQFHTSAKVRWSVDEGDGGGSITRDGLYQAPLVPGVYHVVATSIATPSEAEKATITVGPSELELIAGELGGRGHADDVGADARFRGPGGLAGDGAGHLFVADGAIRKIDVTTGEVTTVVNTESANDVVFDRGVLYGVQNTIWGVYSVFKADPETGAFWTIAGGSGTGLVDGVGTNAQFNDVTGIAADGKDHLFVTELEGYIRRIDLPSGTVTTVAGGSSGSPAVWTDGIGAAAVLAEPSGIAYDGAGLLLFLDLLGTWTSDGRLRSFDPVSGRVSTFGPITVNQTHSPVAGTICGNGFYSAGPSVAPGLNTTPGYPSLRAGSAASGDRDGYSEWARFSERLHIYCDGDSVYVADSENHDVRKIDVSDLKNGYLVSTLAGRNSHSSYLDRNGRELDSPYAEHLAVDSKGANLLYCFAYGHWPYRLDVASRNISDVLPSDTTFDDLGKYTMRSVAIDSDGKYYSVQFQAPIGPSLVTMLDPQTRKQTKIAQGVFGDLVVGGTGVLYVAGKDGVERVDIATGTVTDVVTGIGSPLYLAYGGDAVYAVLSSGHSSLAGRALGDRIVRVPLGEGAVTPLARATAWSDLGQLAYDPAGVLYVTDRGAHRVMAIDVESEQVADVIGASTRQGVKLGAAPGGLNEPVALALMPSGDLVVSDLTEEVVVRARLWR
jgi:sugar lactone lactonase YvrE